MDRGMAARVDTQYIMTYKTIDDTQMVNLMTSRARGAWPLLKSAKEDNDDEYAVDNKWGK